MPTLQRMVRDALASQHMTQADAARRAGLSAQYLSDVLRGRRRLSARAAVRLENVLRLDAGRLLHAQASEELARVRRGA